MNIKNVSISEIRPYERNPRHNDQAVELVANSIREFGWKQPIVVDKDGVIVAGHTRFKAAKKLGLRTVPVVVADDLTEEQIKAYRLADNKTGEAAEWDLSALAVELDGILDLDMEQFGFDDIPDEGWPNVNELDAVGIDDEKTVVRLVFQDFKSYKPHEIEIKNFAENIGATVTIGK